MSSPAKSNEIFIENVKTRRWGRLNRNYEQKTVPNKFGELSPLFFYPLIQGFMESKHDTILWGGENGGRFLSELLITLSTIVECAGSYPSTSILSSDLFEVSWSFHEAQNPEVRRAVLVSVASCLPHLTPDSLAKALCDEQFPLELQRIKQYDSNSDCRQLASIIHEGFRDVSTIMA
jgi:hypothetical protein